MRNRALQLVETTQVLLLDADFVPGRMPHEITMKRGIEWLAPNQVLILAPFSMRSNVTMALQMMHRAHLWTSKQALIHCMEAGAANIADNACKETVVSPYPPYLGAQTNYRHWWSATESYGAT